MVTLVPQLLRSHFELPIEARRPTGGLRVRRRTIVMTTTRRATTKQDATVTPAKRMGFSGIVTSSWTGRLCAATQAAGLDVQVSTVELTARNPVAGSAGRLRPP